MVGPARPHLSAVSYGHDSPKFSRLEYVGSLLTIIGAVIELRVAARLGERELVVAGQSAAEHSYKKKTRAGKEKAETAISPPSQQNFR